VLDARKRRIAENEARFREINDRLEADLRSLAPDDGVTEFVCECGKAECTRTVRLTLDEYRHARQDQMIFVVLPGHEIPDAEDVLARTDRYFAVRKHAEAAPIVEDPPL
jgi:hypothetical protein